jgi:hypothetical protein
MMMSSNLLLFSTNLNFRKEKSHTWNYGVTLKFFLKVVTCISTFMLLLISQHTRHKFCSNVSHAGWSKLDSRLISQVAHSTFMKKFLNLHQIFICSAHGWTCSILLTDVTQFLNLENQQNVFSCTHCFLYESNFYQLTDFCTSFG